MTSWQLVDFDTNNRKLHNYMGNIDEGIILLCANDLCLVEELTEMLHNSYEFELIDCVEMRDFFLARIEQYRQLEKHNRICIYHLEEDSSRYDIIKTLNISRDILRQIGIVVFILPSYAAEEIQLRNPNLYDYITLRLDYNKDYPMYLYPNYSEENRYFIPKQIRTARKKEILAKASSKFKNIEEYYNYLDFFDYKNMSQDDVQKILRWLSDDAKEIFRTEQNANRSEDSYIDMQAQLYKKAAEVFCNQGYCQEGIMLYEEIIYIMQPIAGTTLWEAEAKQGIAYCYYQMGEYDQTIKELEWLLQYESVINNVPWLCKIKNDQAVCYYELGHTDIAIDLLEYCYRTLRQIGEYQVHRKFRILYNIMLICSATGENTKLYEMEWNDIENEIVDNMGMASLEYIDYQLMSSWIDFRLGKTNKASYYAQRAMEIGLSILPENSEKKLQIYYLLYLAAMEKNDISLATDYFMKGKKCIRNSRETKGDYTEWLGET